MSLVSTNPGVTYRVQLHKDFDFNALQQVVPYLKKLGIKTIYAAPIFSAVPGSQHGYDGIDPLTINPEIGDLEQFQELALLLKKHDMMWLQDFVPNHMAFHPANTWLADVLQKGRQSTYASWFDIDWDNPDYTGKLMVPFLGAELEQVIKQKDIKLVYNANGFFLAFAGNDWPVSSHSVARLIHEHQQVFDSQVYHEAARYLSINEHQEDQANHDAFNNFLKEWLTGSGSTSVTADFINKINDNPEQLQSFIDQQHYIPVFWGTTDTRINYRRFFTVNGLICMNMQHQQVFDGYHQFLKQLCDEDLIQGVRIDHIDGLYDPGTYLNRLRELLGPDQYIVVEKILELEENLPGDWPVQGTTGYDFLASVNNVLTDTKAADKFQAYYSKITGTQEDEMLVFEKKHFILQHHMQGELENLVRNYYQLNLPAIVGTTGNDYAIFKKAIALFLVHCPVYRFYDTGFPLREATVSAIKNILEQVRVTHPGAIEEVAFLENLFINHEIANGSDQADKLSAFFTRCMQFTGPLMAKGVEDTLMYNYFNFLSHNEVGASPFQFGISVPDFHEYQQKRASGWPMTMNATDTHDTKRGEDARARMQVVAQDAAGWIEAADQWFKTNKNLSHTYNIHRSDEYFLYQVITAHYPLGENDIDDFKDRLCAYLVKAMREGKSHSDWAKPDTRYEEAFQQFARTILTPGSAFLKKFQSYIAPIIEAGLLVSLNQLILKYTCPGIPDIYQGCEHWNFSFVDPDNRKPVNFTKLETLVDHSRPGEFEFSRLWKKRGNGEVKVSLTRLLSVLRHRYVEIFIKGNYEPVELSGPGANEFIAFTRQYLGEKLLVVLPLHSALVINQINEPEPRLFPKTKLELNLNASMVSNLLSGKKVNTSKKVSVAELFAGQPFGIFHIKTHDAHRKAGLLLHISSLASPFGVGDLGTAAYRFVDFLHKAGQQVWQMLPVNLVDKTQGFSPYSSSSSRAGNILFISPELLLEEGLLTRTDLDNALVAATSNVNYEVAEKVKTTLLDKAWMHFNDSKPGSLLKAFKNFRDEQREWLHDYSLFTLLKKIENNSPWYQWPEEFKSRQSKALKLLSRDHEEELDKIAWMQFMFTYQWKALKKYSNDHGIQLFGDLPFYVSHDSADVWAHRELFKLDKQGNMLAVAGVPPDFFSIDGQLWGMPVFEWNALHKSGYKWWADRLSRNLEMFDIIRLDHFRAFAAYWEVPASSSTAVSGKWVKGPGKRFFTEMQHRLGYLPFVAEDLGDIDEPVYKLRDRFGLRGMKVLQFAFGNNMPASIFIPHNYDKNFVAYTGTHDNNTLVGWLQEADLHTREQLNNYFGKELNELNLFDTIGRVLYGSVANEIIFPVQDVLGLGEEARMNAPSTATGNWNWRLLPGQLTENHQSLLKNWTALYNR